MLLNNLENLVSVHRHFAKWEQTKHRAQAVVVIEFPDSHPVRTTVDALCCDLESCRTRAGDMLFELMKVCRVSFGGGFLNGYFFESLHDMFDPSEKYYDCPTYYIPNSCQRRKTLDLVSLAYLHDLECNGRSYIEAMFDLEGAKPDGKRHLDKLTKAFERKCWRLRKHLKHVKICEKQKVEIVDCLQQAGLTHDTSDLVLQFLA